MRPTRRSVCAALAAPLFALRQSLAADDVSLTAAQGAGEALPRLNSLLVSHQGELVLEHYYRGARASRSANIKSASKTVMSALIGIAVDRGLIKSVDEPIGQYFPKLLGADADVKKRSITVGDLLTMRSGLESTSNRNYGSWVSSANWVRYALQQPLVRDPGARMIYSTGNTHLLSAILTQVVGNTWKFADEALAQPLGFALPRWPTDPQGIYFGGNDMELTPRQMLSFGELYLHAGRQADKQVISENWVRESLTPRTRSWRDTRRLYGYCWWIRDLGGFRTYYAWGYGGQFIFLVPDLDLVAVTTSSTAAGGDRRDHLDAIYDLVEEHVILAYAAGRS
jgi:CubicO group peptidase (beta-lactamase class C family)